ncbi:MAG: hypothetical protein SGPRY_010961, partial [Prymnesium sp.]
VAKAVASPAVAGVATTPARPPQATAVVSAAAARPVRAVSVVSAVPQVPGAPPAAAASAVPASVVTARTVTAVAKPTVTATATAKPSATAAVVTAKPTVVAAGVKPAAVSAVARPTVTAVGAVTKPAIASAVAVAKPTVTAVKPVDSAVSSQPGAIYAIGADESTGGGSESVAVSKQTSSSAAEEREEPSVREAFERLQSIKGGQLTKSELMRMCREDEEIREILFLPKQIRDDDGTLEQARAFAADSLPISSLHHQSCFEPCCSSPTPLPICLAVEKVLRQLDDDDSNLISFEAFSKASVTPQPSLCLAPHPPFSVPPLRLVPPSVTLLDCLPLIGSLVFSSGKRRRRNKGGGEAAGGGKPADAAKAAEKAEAARKAKELAAQKKAEAAAQRKEKALEIARIKREEALAARAAEERAAKVAAELGIGTYELKGDRGYMEDRAVALRLPSGELYAAVFDGHCGEGAPEYCKNHLHSSRPSSHPNPVPQEPRAPEPPPSPPHLSSSEHFESEPKEALMEAFRVTNTTFCRDHDDESGTTAVVAMLRSDQLFCANAGDSRATICRGGQGKAVTRDHKPDDPEEEARVVRAGGQCTWGRVVATDGKNMLACARSIGDSKYKVGPPHGDWSEGPICVTPEVFQLTITSEDRFLIMASDGVWDVLSDQKVCDIVNKSLADDADAPQLAAKAVCLAAYQAE